jgi:hypothetical protein
MIADVALSDNGVQRARAELRILEQERNKLEKQRKTQMKEFDTAKNDARRLLEVTKQRTPIEYGSCDNCFSMFLIESNEKDEFC